MLLYIYITIYTLSWGVLGHGMSFAVVIYFGLKREENHARNMAYN